MQISICITLCDYIPKIGDMGVIFLNKAWYLLEGVKAWYLLEGVKAYLLPAY